MRHGTLRNVSLLSALVPISVRQRPSGLQSLNKTRQFNRIWLLKELIKGGVILGHTYGPLSSTCSPKALRASLQPSATRLLTHSRDTGMSGEHRDPGQGYRGHGVCALRGLLTSPTPLVFRAK